MVPSEGAVPERVGHLTLWLLVAFGTMAPLWLFLANLDQLVPGGASSLEATGATTEFAGGFWHRPDFWRSLNLSLVSASVTTLLVSILGIPAAWALSRLRPAGSWLIEVMISSILVLPASSVGLALIVMFQYGPLRWFQDWLGVSAMYTLFPGMVLAQGVLALAIGMSAWTAAFDAVDRRYEQVARSLGACPAQAFWRVTLPLAAPGLLAGVLLAWVRAIAEFGAVLLFCGTFRELPTSRFGGLATSLGLDRADPLAIAMWSEMEYGNIEYGMALAYALVIASALAVYGMNRLGGRGYVWR